jgi:hypothetical protein
MQSHILQGFEDVEFCPRRIYTFVTEELIRFHDGPRPSTEIVVQQIDSSPLYHLHPGKPHHLADFLSVFRSVAGVWTLFAHGLWIKRATKPHGKTVFEQLRAVWTKLDGFFKKILQDGMLEAKELSAAIMLGATIQGYEACQRPYIPLLSFPYFLFHSVKFFLLAIQPGRASRSWLNGLIGGYGKQPS